MWNFIPQVRKGKIKISALDVSAIKNVYERVRVMTILEEEEKRKKEEQLEDEETKMSKGGMSSDEKQKMFFRKGNYCHNIYTQQVLEETGTHVCNFLCPLT